MGLLERAYDWSLDVDQPADPPPVLFHAIRAPCVCGRALTDNHYTFFPSAVFVHGVCPVCGPQTAIFAPDMKDCGEPIGEAIARRLGRLQADLARTYGVDPRQVISEFLEYLQPTGTDSALRPVTQRNSDFSEE